MPVPECAPFLKPRTALSGPGRSPACRVHRVTRKRAVNAFHPGRAGMVEVAERVVPAVEAGWSWCAEHPTCRPAGRPGQGRPGLQWAEALPSGDSTATGTGIGTRS